tara:strand:- start:805 stop:1647 length:843 start_codon:yes stop_codon:yes gene_type:complete
MFTNTLSFKGKIRVVLSEFKSLILNTFNIKKRLFLYKNWKNIKKPKKKFAIVIGGGPSFNSKIASNIFFKRKYFDIIAINYYCLNKFSIKLIPDYYLLSDPEQVQTEKIKVKKINQIIKKYIIKHKIKFISPYDKRWGFYTKPYLQFNDSQNLITNNIDPRKPRGYRSNTGMKAIAMMLALGYKKIFILGFDYDYPRKITINSKNKLILEENHHYGVKYVDVSNDFYSIAHALNWWALDFWSMRKFKSKKIINVTNKSMIDVFRRISQENFIKKLKKHNS